MGMLKRKAEKTDVLSVRVPVSVYKEFTALTTIADAKGFDLRASLTDAVLRWIRQVREELGTAEGAASESNSAARKARGAVVNGAGEHRGIGEGQD
jgi:hypothetical protein